MTNLSNVMNKNVYEKHTVIFFKKH